VLREAQLSQGHSVWGSCHLWSWILPPKQKTSLLILCTSVILADINILLFVAGSCYVAQAGLQFTVFPPQPPQVLGLQACVTTPSETQHFIGHPWKSKSLLPSCEQIPFLWALLTTR
jgi:hypothetical protein